MKSFSFFPVALLTLCLFPSALHAQDDLNQINLAAKADLDLAALLQWLADEKKMKIVANSDQFPGNQSNKVIFYGDFQVSPETMLEVVQSILRTNGFALVNSDVGGLYQVVQLPNVRTYADLIEGKDPSELPRSEYVTGVFPLEHVTEQETQDYIRRLMYAGVEQDSNNITNIPNRRTLVITETAGRMAKIKLLIEKLDVPADQLKRVFYRVKHLQAEELRQQLAGILSLDSTSGDPGASPNPQSTSRQVLKVDAILRTNQIILSGTVAQIKEAMDLIEKLDVENQLKIRTFQFTRVSAKQIDELIRGRLKGVGEQQLEKIYQSDINQQANQLIVTARDEIHAQIDSLRRQLDQEEALGPAKSPMKFYVLKNVKAIDLLDTLQAIERRVASRPRDRDPRDRRLTGINPVGSFGTGTLLDDVPPSTGRQSAGRLDQVGDRIGLAEFQDGFDQSGRFGSSLISDIAQLTSSLGVAEKLIPGEAKVTVDENTNTLIVVADPQIQQLYAELIEKLDVRRPQVLIEVKLVTITGQEDFDLGLEISGGDREGDRRLFGFSSFNLSSINAATGALSLNPGLGFNGTLIDAATADVVLRALSRHRRARVVTAPRILVNDNTTGLLSSVAEVPFEANNIGNTIATTSFGGFAQAGTTISVTPQISEDDYLNLEFDVQVNNFTGQPTATLPPPRNTDQVTSEINIPDGHTAIVGGLTRVSQSEDIIGIPFIENIPLLRRLFGRETDGWETQRIYVFIKPIILRDDRFRDLRFLSEVERSNACIPGDLPQSFPLMIR